MRSTAGGIDLTATALEILLRADAFGLALAYAATKSTSSTSTTGALAIGVGVGHVKLRRRVESSIDSSTVEAFGDIDLAATSGGSMASLGVGVAASVARGTGSTGAVAGAGSASWNTLDGTVAASIENSGGDRHVTSSNGRVTLSAEDSLDVTGVAGTIAFALGLSSGQGKATVAVAAGVALVINEIGIDEGYGDTDHEGDDAGRLTAATIDNSKVTSYGDLLMTATSDARTLAVAVGGSGAVAGSTSSAGPQPTGAFAGTGVGTGNTVRQTITAEITGGSEVTSPGQTCAPTAPSICSCSSAPSFCRS